MHLSRKGHDALHASSQELFLYKFRSHPDWINVNMCCFLILDVHGERSDADVFCLRPGCNRLDPVSVSWVAFRPDLRLSSPYDDY